MVMRIEKCPIFQPNTERPMAHCATLAARSDEALLAAWYAGSREGAADVAILSAVWQGANWSEPQVIVQVTGHSLGQPVFLPRPDGEVWLFYVIIDGLEQRPPLRREVDALSPVSGWRRAQPFWQRSRDGGETWEAPQQIMDYPGLMFRSHPLILPGRILLPVYDENTWQSRMLLSEDEAQSWRLTAPISTPPGNIQPCLAPLSDGRLLAYLRTGGPGGWIWRTTSSDGGVTWKVPTPTDLPNPNSGIDLLGLQSGSLALAYNPSVSQRTPLWVRLAGEDERWQTQRTLEEGSGEFSYPALFQAADGIIHLVYTYKRQYIQHARFTESWLAGEEPNHAA
jgi:predicted neuraminidase